MNSTEPRDGMELWLGFARELEEELLAAAQILEILFHICLAMVVLRVPDISVLLENAPRPLSSGFWLGIDPNG